VTRGRHARSAESEGGRDGVSEGGREGGVKKGREGKGGEEREREREVSVWCGASVTIRSFLSMLVEVKISRSNASF
jgi:hypothetical protein